MAFVNLNDSVAKGAVTWCLDKLSVRPDARDRLTELRDGIAALRGENFRGLERVFAERLFNYFYDPDQVASITRYLRQYWFDEATGWWPAFQPIAPVYALGLLQTLNISLYAQQAPVPIDSYWIIGHGQVELLNLANARQVTLLIATPTPPEPAPSGIWGESSEAWVTTRRAGRTDLEVDPITGATVTGGGTDSRVRTYKIQSRGRSQA